VTLKRGSGEDLYLLLAQREGEGGQSTRGTIGRMSGIELTIKSCKKTAQGRAVGRALFETPPAALTRGK